MKVAVVIVNYKVHQEVFDCLDSLFALNKDIDLDVIVIDNESKNTLEKPLAKKFPKVKYMQSTQNLGYGGGNNLGSKFVDGEYLFVLNPDTRLVEGSISKLIKNFKKDVAIVAPVLLDKNGEPYELQGTRELTPGRAIFSLSFLSKILRKNKIYREYYFLGWDKKKKKEVDVVPGSAFIIKKEIFHKIGGFDRFFFLYFEEFDLCRRLRNLNYKLLISPDLKIFHAWGRSTAKSSNTDKIFRQSRFYYFRKNFGLLKALPTEAILRFNLQTFALVSILFIAGFLRLYKLPEVMPFIPDIAWFYISARDMLVNHQIPLLGIESSRVWLHQGPLWTYMMAPVLKLASFNPVAPAYFTVLMDLLSLTILFYFIKSLFGFRIAFFSSLFYSTSPWIIFSSQTPYHTSPIPLFTLLLMISVYKWIKGNVLYFPVIMFLIGVLYNLELATFPLFAIPGFLFLNGLLKKKDYVSKLKKLRLILLSLTSFIIPMIPMLIYDFSHGFPQTFRFLVWVVYRIAVFLGYPPINPNSFVEPWNNFINFIFDYIQRIYFLPNRWIALGLFSISISFFLLSAARKRFKDFPMNLICLFFLIPALGYLAARTNSAAYLPMFFISASIIFGYMLGSVRSKLMFLSIAVSLIVSGIVLLGFPYRSFHDVSFQKRVDASKSIIDKSGEANFNVISTFKPEENEKYTKHYQYLTWWLGKSASKDEKVIKYFITENSSRIDIREVR